MQNAYQAYFKDRSLFYSTFPIREQAPKGLSLIHISTPSVPMPVLLALGDDELADGSGIGTDGVDACLLYTSRCV